MAVATYYPFSALIYSFIVFVFVQYQLLYKFLFPTSSARLYVCMFTTLAGLSLQFTAIWQTSHDVDTECCRRKHKTSFHAFSFFSIFPSHFYIYRNYSLYLLHGSLVCASLFVPPTASPESESRHWPRSLGSHSAPHTQRLADLVTELFHSRDQWQCADIPAAQMSAPPAPGAAGRSSLNR